MVSDENTACNGLFECTLCGDCCKGYGGTYLSETDIHAISQYIGVSEERLISDYTCKSGNRRVVAQGPDGYCIFWDKVCTIHSVKPKMCRQWPFIRSVLVDVANWRAMTASCPGMNPAASDQEIVACVKKKMGL